MPRRWIKVWVQESLTGTVRFDFTPAERGVWYDLLILAGNCRLEGVIAAGSGKPYPHSWIAGTLNIPLDLLEMTLRKCQESERIYENEDGIHIINWARYQSEYERQKPYRRKEVAKPEKEGGELAVISKLYEENIGRLTPVAADRLKDIAQTYLPGWFGEALKEAVVAEHRNLKYIETILERWKVEGFKSPRLGAKAKRQLPTTQELEEGWKE